MGRPCKLSSTQKDQALLELANGRGWKEICKELNISQTTLWRCRREAEMQKRLDMAVRIANGGATNKTGVVSDGN
jgi:hypothetical protein